MFCACGDDNNSTGGDGSDNQPSKRISKIIEEEGGSLYEYTLSYDSQGRVIKIIGTESGIYRNGRSEKTYQYGETLIVTKEVEEETYSSGQSYTFTESHSYTLENGRIVKDEERQNGSFETTTYSYDAIGQLASISYSGTHSGNQAKTVTWSDRNLIKVEYGSFTYSNYRWTKGFHRYLKGTDTDFCLFSMGYYGNIPHNLPSSYKYDNSNEGWEYDYTLQDGLVTKVAATPLGNIKGSNGITTYIWE